MSDTPLQNYIVVTDNGERDWQAEDADHARDQHEDAFADEPGETIISVRLEEAEQANPDTSNATTAHYKYAGESVEIEGPLTETQFRAIEAILGKPESRFKEWAERFYFEPPHPGRTEALLGYLRDQRLWHCVERADSWSPDPATAGTRGADAGGAQREPDEQRADAAHGRPVTP